MSIRVGIPFTNVSFRIGRVSDAEQAADLAQARAEQVKEAVGRMMENAGERKAIAGNTPSQKEAELAKQTEYNPANASELKAMLDSNPKAAQVLKTAGMMTDKPWQPMPGDADKPIGRA